MQRGVILALIALALAWAAPSRASIYFSGYQEEMWDLMGNPISSTPAVPLEWFGVSQTLPDAALAVCLHDLKIKRQILQAGDARCVFMQSKPSPAAPMSHWKRD